MPKKKKVFITTIKGIGRIKINKKMPKRFPKTVRILGKTFKAGQRFQRLFFIKKHLAKGEVARLKKLR